MMGKRRRIISTIIVGLCVIGIIGIFTLKHLECPSSEDDVTVTAIVNGCIIKEKDIAKLYQQLDGEYSRANILKDLIDELVVVTYAPSIGIEITDEQIRSELKDYQESLPDLYNEGMQIYGEEDFYDGYSMQLIYNMVYDVIVEQLLQQDRQRFTEEFYLSMKEKGETTEQDVPEKFIDERMDEFYEYVFENWIQEQRKEADIKILSNEEVYHEINEKLFSKGISDVVCFYFSRDAIRSENT